MGAVKKGVKRFKKGLEKAKKKFGEGHAQYNKGARSKPREQEKDMEEVETLDTVMHVSATACIICWIFAVLPKLASVLHCLLYTLLTLPISFFSPIRCFEDR